MLEHAHEASRLNKPILIWEGLGMIQMRKGALTLPQSQRSCCATALAHPWLSVASGGGARKSTLMHAAACWPHPAHSNLCQTAWLGELLYRCAGAGLLTAPVPLATRSLACPRGPAAVPRTKSRGCAVKGPPLPRPAPPSRPPGGLAAAVSNASDGTTRWLWCGPECKWCCVQSSVNHSLWCF